MITLQEFKYLNDKSMSNVNMVMSIPVNLTINSGYDIPITSDDIGEINFFMVSGNDVLGDNVKVSPIPVKLDGAIPLVMIEFDPSIQSAFMANETYAIKKTIEINNKQYLVAYAKRVQYISDYNIYFTDGSSINTLTDENIACINNETCDGMLGFSHKFKLELNQDELECISNYGNLVYGKDINIERLALIRASYNNGEISKGIISYIKKNLILVKNYLVERNVYISTVEIGKMLDAGKVDV